VTPGVTPDAGEASKWVTAQLPGPKSSNRTGGWQPKSRQSVTGSPVGNSIGMWIGMRPAA